MELIVGGTGTLGSRVARILLERGDEVSIMTHHPEGGAAANLLALGAEVVPGDLRDVASVRAAVADVDTLVVSVQALAGPGATRHNNPTTVDDAGVRTLLEAAKAAGVRHVVYVSVAGASPDAEPEFVRIKYQTERTVRESGMSWSIVRPAAFMEVWGPIIGGPVLSGGTPMVFGDGENPVNFVSADDVAKFVMLGVDRTVQGETLTVGGPEDLTLNEVVDLFAKCADAPRKARKIPVGAMRAMSALMSPFNPALSRQMGAGVWMASTDQRVDMTSLLQRFPMELTRMHDVAQGLVSARKSGAP